MADIKMAYAASANATVTNLHSIATSADWTSGWTSAAIDNSTNLYIDHLLSGEIVVAASGLAAAKIQVRVYAELDDSNYPDLFSAGTEGTEGTATVHDTNVLTVLKLAASLDTDTTASQVYPFGPLSVAALFGGVCPRKFCVFISHSTGANLAASGNQVTTKGVYFTN